MKLPECSNLFFIITNKVIEWSHPIVSIIQRKWTRWLVRSKNRIVWALAVHKISVTPKRRALQGECVVSWQHALNSRNSKLFIRLVKLPPLDISPLVLMKIWRVHIDRGDKLTGCRRLDIWFVLGATTRVGLSSIKLLRQRSDFSLIPSFFVSQTKGLNTNDCLYFACSEARNFNSSSL